MSVGAGHRRAVVGIFEAQGGRVPALSASECRTGLFCRAYSAELGQLQGWRRKMKPSGVRALPGQDKGGVILPVARMPCNQSSAADTTRNGFGVAVVARHAALKCSITCSALRANALKVVCASRMTVT
jgi:hypothetical protein